VYDVLLTRYVGPLQRAGSRPRNVFAGLRSLEACADVWQPIPPSRTATPAIGDAHPPPPVRARRAAGLPSPRRAPRAARARDLLSVADALEEQLTERLLDPRAGAALAVVDDWRRALEIIARDHLRRRAWALLSAVALVDGGPAPADLARLLHVLREGGSPRLAAHRGGGDPPGQLPSDLVAEVADLLACALVEQGAGHLEPSWRLPGVVRDAEGVPLDLAAWARAAVEGQEGLADLLDELLTRSITWAWQPAPSLPPGRPAPAAGGALVVLPLDASAP
jgi:hypothetical protein